MVDVLSIAFVLLYHLKMSQSILNCLLLHIVLYLFIGGALLKS